MRPSKGPRVDLHLRLKPETHEALQRYKLQNGLDGMPAVIEELAALVKDRDEALEDALRQKREALELASAFRDEAAKAARESRHWKSRALRLGARKELRKGGEFRVPDVWIERARETPCGGGCGGLMDPAGLMRGLSWCPGCRVG